jgi:medium-chain acyl-[acyl-carrier-protein] hydrolase
MNPVVESWLRPRVPSTASDIDGRLVCCAHAGGGATAFNGWARRLPPGFAVIKVQLPGREDNWECAPIRSIHALVARLASQAIPLLDRPLALYGHSMGAIVMFELAREFRRRGHPLPACLFVSGRRAPQLPLSHPALFSLSDEDLIARMRSMGAANPELFDKPRWRDHFFPAIRADLQISDLYEYYREPPLECPIYAFGGHDDSTVKHWEWQAWREQTSAGFAGQALSGRHFFDKDGQAALLHAVGSILMSLLPARTRPACHGTA